MQHSWDFATIIENWPVLWVGIKGTVLIFLVTVILGLGGGLIIGMGRYARSPALRWPSTVFGLRSFHGNSGMLTPGNRPRS